MRVRTVLVLVASLAVPPSLLADKPKKGKKGEKGKGSTEVVVFVDDERETVRRYFVEKHGRGNCPPGLAKKNNGCLPPGQAKKRYRVGAPLPRAVVYEEAPTELTVKLRPCPPGYRYVVVDGDLVKLAIGTLMVVDAIDGLVH